MVLLHVKEASAAVAVVSVTQRLDRAVDANKHRGERARVGRGSADRAPPFPTAHERKRQGNFGSSSRHVVVPKTFTFLLVLTYFLLLSCLGVKASNTLALGGEFGMAACLDFGIGPMCASVQRHRHGLRIIDGERRRRWPNFTSRAPIAQAHAFEQTRCVACETVQTTRHQLRFTEVRRPARIAQMQCTALLLKGGELREYLNNLPDGVRICVGQLLRQFLAFEF